MKSPFPAIVTMLLLLLLIGIPFMGVLVNAECCWDGCKGTG